MANFKYALGQAVWTKAGHACTVQGRTEFMGGKANRYYVTSEEPFPGKNIAEDWANEVDLLDAKPVIEAEPLKLKNQRKVGKAPERVEATTTRRKR